MSGYTALKEATLNPARQQKAKEYNNLRRCLLFAQFGICIAILLALLFSGISSELASFSGLSLPWGAALYLLILVLGYGVIMAPLGYYQDFVLPHRYGLSTQSLTSWLKDRAKALSLGLSLSLCLVIAIYWLIVKLPALWWLAAGWIILLISFLLTWLTPTILIPLFFKLKPLENGELKERLANLAKRTGVDIDDVLTMNLSRKGTTANAMLSGWGKSRRIIITDTLLQGYPLDEIEVTLAHELGHHLHHDIPKLMAIQILTFLMAFYLANLALKLGVALFSLRGVADLTGLPWLILVLAAVMVALQPLLNWYNRHIELAADKRALELSHNPQAFIDLMAKLTEQNLQEAEPNRWAKLLFYDHPSCSERVRLAHNYGQKSLLKSEA